MIRMVPALLAALLLAAPAWRSPTQAQAQAEDARTLRAVREFADLTSGRRPGNGQPADKMLAFGRNAAGEIVVTAMIVLAPNDPWVDPPTGAIAVMRTRAGTGNGNIAPDAADIAFVQRSGMRVFIVGEWATPPVIWEVARGAHVRFRAIGADARPGRWLTPVNLPAPASRP